ncbi:MAG TPA: ribbon-helix-helix protein, CopG family [Promineifilum sp.]|nr:ribbon-helix-helix protein, CopG family [Promineifilum sp.]
MSKKRGAAQPDIGSGLTQVSVYLPDDLLARLRNEAKKERRSLSSQIVLLLERYDDEGTPELARQLRAALDREGYPTT